MKGTDLIIALKRKLELHTDASLRDALGISGMTLQNWRRRRSLTPRIVAEQISKGLLSGQDIIEALTRHFHSKSLKELSKQLGLSGQAVQNWKNRSGVTERQIAGLVKGASEAGSSNAYRNAVRPLVEFMFIAKSESRGGVNFELFATRSVKGKYNAYFNGLQKELNKHHGVYIFFDSRGRAIYAGKARKQFLWREIIMAFNRDRGPIQKIRRVRHPSRNQAYRTSEEKSRQIREHEVPLHELAAYISVYAVADPLIDDMESLLVRCFANDLLNKRMERFGRQRSRV